MVDFYCIICNELKDEPMNVLEFLYMDEMNAGKPVCTDCQPLVWDLKNYAKSKKYFAEKHKITDAKQEQMKPSCVGCTDFNFDEEEMLLKCVENCTHRYKKTLLDKWM